MSKKLPLLILRDQYKRHRPHTDLLRIATQLGILPDLRYLVDGLTRSKGCLRADEAEMLICLRAIPGGWLEPELLVEEIDHLIRWTQTQNWDDDDVRLLEMVRPKETDPHPLSGYCLSVAFHWANLFYTLEPGTAHTLPNNPDQQPYESLMEEFSTYVLAAQCTIEPDDYLRFCGTWWSTGVLPQRPPFADHRLTSRVANASRAMRRITLAEYRGLFHILSDRINSDPFHARVYQARPTELNDLEKRALHAITLLLEDIRIGWCKPRSRSGQGRAAQSVLPRRTVSQHFRDGYVRIAASDSMYLTYETDSGLDIQSVLPMPVSVEDVARTLSADIEYELDMEDEGAGPRKGEKDTDKAAARKQGKEARRHLLETAQNEAEIMLDGAEWIPAEEAAGADHIEAVMIEPDGDQVDASASGIHPGNSSKWAAEHVRRYHLAHGLTKDRLSLTEAKQLLGAIQREPPDSENTRALVCLHACIAIGRSFVHASNLQIHTTMPGHDVDLKRIHYVLESERWILPAPPAAWHNLQRTRNERVQWDQIWLNDQTGFRNLLMHFGLAADGRPVKRLSGTRRRSIEAWIQRTLPDADASLRTCAQFLFYRLLAVTRGDLGVASLITRNDHSHGRSIAHYAHYAAPRLWRAYQNAWSGHPKPYLVKSGCHNSDPSNQPVVRGYGARRVPTDAAVRSMITFLHTKIRSTRGAEQNNFYTAYTLAGLVLGLGMRPVIEPLLADIGENMADLLVATYLDKARNDYHRRINAVPRVLATHLDRYSHYLRIQNQWRNPNDPLPAMFRYIDPDTKEPELFRPSQFEALTRPVFGLELYALRRFARTRLIEDPEAYAEDLDAYMGHWFDRVSPHDPLSTYPMARVQAFAQGPVSRMLQDTGFKPVRIHA